MSHPADQQSPSTSLGCSASHECKAADPLDASQMRASTAKSVERLEGLLDLYRKAAYGADLVICPHCEKFVNTMDRNDRGICTDCEMRGE